MASEENLAFFRQNGDRWGLGWTLVGLGNWATEFGKHEEARQYLLESLALFRALGNRWAATWALNALGLVTEHLGDYRQAQAWYQESHKFCEETGDQGGVAYTNIRLGVVACRLGEHARARAYVREGLRLHRALFGNDSPLPCGVCKAAELLVEEGRFEDAAEVFGALRSLLEKPYCIRVVEGHLDRSAAQLSPEVFTAARQRGVERDFATTEKVLFEQLLAPDEDIDSGEPQVGTPSLRGDQPQVEPLTERELEVLRLIATGLSNREIAEQLVVGMSTVSKHINHLYGKLAVTSRMQAALRARALNLL